MRRRPAAKEPFARVACRITDAFCAGDLTRDEYVLVNYIVARIYKDEPRDDVLVTKLRVIKDETSWALGTERIRQVLDGLTDRGWLDARPRAAGSKFWEVRLTGAAVAEEGSEARETRPGDSEVGAGGSDGEPAESGPPDLEVASKSAPAADGAGPPESADSGGAEPPSSGSPLEVEAERERAVSERGAVEGDTPAVGLAGEDDPEAFKLAWVDARFGGDRGAYQDWLCESTDRMLAVSRRLAVERER